MNCVLIEDDLLFQQVIERHIQQYKAYSINVIEKCQTVQTAITAIKNHQPQFIFLDVELLDGRGMDILDAFEKIEFEVIFTTSHDKYAINAIKNNCLDYLLKPIQYKDFCSAIEKLVLKLEAKERLTKIREIEAKAQQIQEKESAKLMLQSKDGIQFVPIKDIVALSSESNYTIFYMLDNSKIIIAKTLKEYESKLIEFHFFRCHKSHIININSIKELGTYNTAIMKNGMEIEISKRKKKEFLELLNQS
ncbi:MAG: response regulator transcription factor [Chitinophagales bacterium]|nr:response regulator transcription factor [Chitinophagales bacterium]